MDQRLNKHIAHSGIASRRHADELILAGKVQVDGTVVRELGARVPEGASIVIDGIPLLDVKRVTYLLYKPRGIVSSRSQQGSAEIITSLVPADPPVYPIGRLDQESEGLILLSNDGELTQALTHPSFAHSKTYTVTTHAQEKIPTAARVKRLLKGVSLKDGYARADAVEILLDKTPNLTLSIRVHEGRNHLVRRMCGAVGLSVLRLVRTEISGLTSTSLRPGEWRVLTDQEIASLRRTA